MAGQILNMQGEDPIIFTHFECWLEDCETEAENSEAYRKAFESACADCKERTGNVLVELLPQVFKDKEGTHEAWEKLAEVYVQHGDDVYCDSDEFFEVYPAEEKAEDTKKFIYIVQTEFQGVPEEPEVYACEKKADEAYINYVNDYTDSETKTYDEAYDVMHKNWGCSDGAVRMFTPEVQP